MCHKDTKAYTVKSTKYKQFSKHVTYKGMETEIITINYN